MNILPGPVQTTAIALSIAFPVLLFCYARIPGIRGAGLRFRIGSFTAAGLLGAFCLALPGQRDVGDILGGVLLLATAMLLYHVLWSLLAWGFTLTLLTALAGAGRPLTQEQWISVYMQGDNLGAFGHNRLRLLLGSGMVTSAGGEIVVTRTGMATVRLVRLIRLTAGIG